ncbi:MAG: hypothetical protein SPI06_12610 [Terrisporobacter sp.]|uniref:hypothetical protein n=1 Tax=Terrisporobacter sp. TaxID=1965305 RepID=UPI002A4966C2|nr:hypothetical protein [Terrisporobacter sp.]MCI5630102.1 hypothetical protein [Clostridium sp.]MDD5879610.1 hypothetical protein [Clostridiales bacterium]MCI6456396.1 hypothetical protein [Clostridium sp.]MCI7207224.1 hypothetical protein [Clostridium sp.]MDY6154239.1 hypothetical protein [Terrisporobacter sp.]
MEEIKKISNMGYDIGKKAKLHEIELLSLLEMIKYDQYHDFLKRIFEIARKVKVSIPDELYKYDHDTFEKYIHALWDGLMSSCSTLKVEV